MNEILPALISAGAAILVCLINNIIQANQIRNANQQNYTLIMYRLGQLEQKQDKHNNLIERTFKLEGQVSELQHDVRDLKGTKE